MGKNTKNYMLGVAFGFVGLILYCLNLEGYEYIEVEDILELLKSLALPFMFTELWVMLTVEGLRNLKSDFDKFRAKQRAKKISKSAEA